MTDTLDSAGAMPDSAAPSTLPPPSPPPPPPPSPPSAQHAGSASKPQRVRSAGHVAALIIGCLLLLPGLGLVAGGGSIALGQAVATDDDGYFRFTIDRLETEGVAIAMTDPWLDDVEGDGEPWVFDFLDVDLRLRVDGASSTDDVFVGIARSDDVARYLDGATYSDLVEFENRTPDYEQVIGERVVDPPIDQDFWTESAAGTGTQQLDWEARAGRWSVVVMNTDGSPVVAADVEVGARSGAVTPIAVSLLVSGVVVVAIAGIVILIGARGRRDSR